MCGKLALQGMSEEEKRNTRQMNITEWAKSWKGKYRRKVILRGRDNLRTVPKKPVQRQGGL